MSELYKKFGELLKIERNRKSLKIEDLSDQLKISATNLEYIEGGDVGSLPSLIYYNLFAKAYAEALGIDFERTIEAIKEDLGELPQNGEPSAAKPPTGKTQKKKPADAEKETEDAESTISVKKMLYMFGGIVGIFVVFLVIYLVFFSSDDLPTGIRTDTTEVTQPEDEVARTEPADEESSYDWDVPEYKVPQKLSLRLTPRNESWSTVLADGDTVIFRNLIPGRVYDAEADYRLIVSVGIPSQVDIELNGKVVDLSDPETRRISRVEINQINLDSFLNRDATESLPSETTNRPAPVGPDGTAEDSGGVSDDEA